MDSPQEIEVIDSIPELVAYHQQLMAALWHATHNASPDLAKINESIAKIRDELVTLKEKYVPPLTKAASNLQKLKEEVVDESMKGTGELSIAAQYLIEQEIEKAESDLSGLSSDHRSVHTSISKAGKEIDRFLGKNLSGLFKGQKNLEKDKELRDLSSQLIAQHLQSSGYDESAMVLVQEAKVTAPKEELPTDRLSIETITNLLREKDLASLCEWQQSFDPTNVSLRSDLDKMKVIKMIKAGESKDAIAYCKNMRTRVDCDREFGRIITAAFFKKPSGKYSNQQLHGIWDALQKRIMHAMTYEQCVLPYLLRIGIRAIPNLMNVRQLMDKRPDFLFSGDELPIAISLKCDGHSTITCPILRQQVTVANPAMRLNCGHVISRDAMNKLSQSVRGHRIKCPYCPTESTPEQAKELQFCERKTDTDLESQ
ncbi:hypothetical protein PFISCL1PPCAC_27363 [Pristionchus fissidentatus]|uniref:RING-Gid-type domain-containing protein n=1 Tax=Pristionchus fissidentatus TaxID=1538716 RepID=A0AAV5WY39_9BILA|nr:hypothetical protein PFISCL1PPCAC_27363 [Pristionchus fissidentatus]